MKDSLWHCNEGRFDVEEESTESGALIPSEISG